MAEPVEVIRVNAIHLVTRRAGERVAAHGAVPRARPLLLLLLRWQGDRRRVRPIWKVQSEEDAARVARRNILGWLSIL